MDRLIDTEELAKHLGVSARTVDTWRTAGEGPDYIKVGAQVRYRPSDVDEWLDTARIIQGNTAGRTKPGPGWHEFVTNAIQPSDEIVTRRNLWTAWHQYLAEEPRAQERGDGPQLESDIRHALQKFFPVEPDGCGLNGIRLTDYGQNLLIAGRAREWNLPDAAAAAFLGHGLTGGPIGIGV